MSMREAPWKDSFDPVPVQAARVLRRVQAICHPPREITVTLDVDESLYVSADPELLFFVLKALVYAACADQADFAIVALSCDADESGIRIEAVGEPGASHGNRELLNAAELTVAGQSIGWMGGLLDLTRDPESGRLFRITLPVARPSRITSSQSGFHRL